MPVRYQIFHMIVGCVKVAQCHSLSSHWWPLVNSRLDYGNGALIGLLVYLTRRLQSVLNAAARLIFNSCCSDHVSLFIGCVFLSASRPKLSSWCTRSSTAVHRHTSGVELPATGGCVGAVSGDLPYATQDVHVHEIMS